ncbi:hypothetical protein PIB30_039650 [Stylosanthes scabra]|uniref:Uncharacterized protein n=1 Tax=Stylosanthes scabra TaxID=79078 RepID=A0ABU6TFD6_9FABA|nr:hypothetical protein [Stylosanthes scabra]
MIDGNDNGANSDDEHTKDWISSRLYTCAQRTVPSSSVGCANAKDNNSAEELDAQAPKPAPRRPYSAPRAKFPAPRRPNQSLGTQQQLQRPDKHHSGAWALSSTQDQSDLGL